MPDVNYIITIKGDGVGGVVTNGVAPSGGVTAERSTDTRVPSMLKRVAPAAIAGQIAKTVIRGELHRVEVRTGFSTAQERLNFAVSKAAGIATPIIAGAMTAGPAGAIIGGGLAIFNEALQYSQAKETYNLNRTIENISIGMADVRAGAGGDRTGQK